MLFATTLHAADENFYLPGEPAGAFHGSASATGMIFGNNAVNSTFATGRGQVRLLSLKNQFTGEILDWGDPNLFTLHLDAKSLASSAMTITSPPVLVDLKADQNSANLAARSPGKAITATFHDAGTGVDVTWTAIGRAGSNYLRQELAVSTRKPVAIKEIGMIRTPLVGASLLGYTDGSPIGCGNWVIGVEHPMAKNSAGGPGGWTPEDMGTNRITRTITGLKPGPCAVTFAYKSGNHRINIRKVTLLADGKPVSEDVHTGFSGHSSEKNTYQLVVPSGLNTATMEVTLANEPGQYDGHGEIKVGNGQLSGGVATAALPRGFTLVPGVTWKLSSHITAAPAGQTRRAFAYYLQRERAHPYRQYWHYNSWYDLNIGRNDLDDPLKRMNEAQCLHVIDSFDKNLFQKHKVGLNGFVWDDGWDDWNTMWGFHKGFPNGFAKLNEAARPQGARMGAWLSPWGGYGRSHDMRVNLGKQQGYETNSGGLSLGGPRYRAAFRDTCLKMIRDYQQDYFKFDGIGVGTWATGAPVAISADLDGLISVTRDLRQANPSVFINCTVGTWASPYWMIFADSVWRQGEDTEFAGKGNPRERWINYKDGIVHRRFSSVSPMFPLNSLMYHGLVLGPVANPGKMPTPAQDIASFRHEIQMMAGYASGLGELYVTPDLMNAEAWSLLAECLQWTRANQRLLADSHWIGGNPEKGEIYGMAAWLPEDGGVLTLRNPDDKPQSINIDLAAVWELPASITGGVELRSPWAVDAGKPAIKADVKQALVVTLQPFEVINLRTTQTGKQPP